MSKKDHYYTRSWDLDKPKGIVLLVHGLAEHSERYLALGNYFVAHHYAMMTIDLPGHGRSPGTPGHIQRFSDYINAALALHKSIRARYPEQPVFLLGHSMGGLIATQLLLDHQKLFNGALLSGAAIQSPQAPPNWQVAVIKALSVLAPRLGILELDASCISRDPLVVKKYMKDPLVYKGKLSARFLVEMTKAMDDCKARAANIKLPISIMHGGADVITAPEGSQLIFEKIKSRDKAIKIYDGLFHEIFNEPEAESIYAEMVSWLDSHC